MDYWRLSFKLFSIPVNLRLDEIWTPSKVTRARTGYSRSDGTLEMLPARARGSAGKFVAGFCGAGLAVAVVTLLWLVSLRVPFSAWLNGHQQDPRPLLGSPYFDTQTDIWETDIWVTDKARTGMRHLCAGAAHACAHTHASTHKFAPARPRTRINAYTLIHTHTHTYTYTHIHTRINTYTHIHNYAYTHTHIDTYTITNMHTYTYAYTCAGTHKFGYLSEQVSVGPEAFHSRWETFFERACLVWAESERSV